MHHQDPDLEQSLFFLIKRTLRTFRGYMHRSFAKAGYDVTIEQWKVLRHLWCKDGQRQQDLADVVHKDKTGITRIVDSMEKRNLVVRIPDRSDRRQKLIYLTNKGKELQGELMQLIQNIYLDAEQGIEPEYLDILKKVLTEINSNLSNS